MSLVLQTGFWRRHSQPNAQSGASSRRSGGPPEAPFMRARSALP
jgi:hypothetical protein